MEFEPIIGLEIHVQPKTKSKMFCSCTADSFGAEPNSYVCPVCLGLPGALPVANADAIKKTRILGSALKCKIQHFSKFDRKNYFYPDLPKGYQISQYDEPISTGGLLRSIRIRRVHLEEDTGKILHKKDYSLIDFNRSGIPLIEIVTEPDIRSAEEAVYFLEQIQGIIRNQDVSDANMEKGTMRLEPNISVREVESQKVKVKSNENIYPDYKVEVKNINSFKFMAKAISYEIERQIKLLKTGKKVTQETRGWDEKKQVTFSQRVKEEAQDYRYFPEPDLPPLKIGETGVGNIERQLTEKTYFEKEDKIINFCKKYNIKPSQAIKLGIGTKINITKWYEEAVKEDMEVSGRSKGDSGKKVYNEFERTLSKYGDEEVKEINKETYKPEYFAEAIRAKDNGLITQSGFESVVRNSFFHNKSPVEFIRKEIEELKSIEKDIENIIDSVINENRKAVDDFRSGKENVIIFLIGQVMKKSKGKADPKLSAKLLKKCIK